MNSFKYLVSYKVYGTEVEMVLLADFSELGVEVDLVSFHKAFQSFQIVVDHTVIEVQAPAASPTTATSKTSTDTCDARRHSNR